MSGQNERPGCRREVPTKKWIAPTTLRGVTRERRGTSNMLGERDPHPTATAGSLIDVLRARRGDPERRRARRHGGVTSGISVSSVASLVRMPRGVSQ